MQLDKKPCLVRKLGSWAGLCSGLIVSLTQCAPQSELPVLITDLNSPPPKLEISPPAFAQQSWPEGRTPVAHVNLVTIPPNYPVDIAVSADLKTVDDFAADLDALAVLNGGFFDPNNAQTTSFITVNGSLLADPRHNRRLVDNPDLAIYMEQILNRSEFRRYDCSDLSGDLIRYDITAHNAPLPSGCELHSALGAGPQLLPQDTSQAEGFTDYTNGTLSRDAIGTQQRNARSAIGIKPDGSLVWVMVTQIESAGGMTLAELAEFMATLDVQKALNLDGGSSSSLYFDQPADSDRISDPHFTEQRPVKSVMYLQLPQL
ncbi:phosphodiester glycosidase family protein [Leptolyngbya cf. ectocarpi LEGE 11479]|uniref:Phosphodiester glycosidase family protein n=1 Tax=Leptolyngbya cf. ectocarpi LEGE 11479 TaxID=1828722 RepID=A0A928ZS82_LEPEC|nr:phosphodiester glycosidase family protein [Leptolyngbya ectocarpi]MBE9065787.1 phosphodiester glycosidase family protein [Leptolyngbya cf. ectocarpi LEGE 11479]